jgi:hypothetical protein
LRSDEGVDASCNIVILFLLIQLEHRPKNIRIHLAVARVRFYLIGFNSSENFCDGGASDEKWSKNQEKHCGKATIANTTGLRVLTAIAAAVGTREQVLCLVKMIKMIKVIKFNDWTGAKSFVLSRCSR